MGIVLLAAGGVIFILSFIIPAKKGEVSDGTRELAQEEIQKLVSKEMEGIKGHVDEVVGEAMEYAMEKTERSLERLSNEKIMAVSEYSDTVLQEIHKNHEEVMFLYDMLNDKHTNLKNTVSKANQAAKAVEESTREAEAAVNSFKQLRPENGAAKEPGQAEGASAPEPFVLAAAAGHPGTLMRTQEEKIEKLASFTRLAKEEAVSGNGDAKNDAAAGESGAGGKEQILKLHGSGKSAVQIARELGIGVGEVKLVIDLYKNL